MDVVLGAGSSVPTDELGVSGIVMKGLKGVGGPGCGEYVSEVAGDSAE